MFGIGSTELLVILVVALIVLGPKSLANVSRTLGKAVGEFRRVSTDFQRILNAEAADDDLRQRKKEAAQAAREARQTKREATACAGTDAPCPPGQPADAAFPPTAEQTVEPPAGSPLAEALAKARDAAATTPHAAAPDMAERTSCASPNEKG